MIIPVINHAHGVISFNGHEFKVALSHDDDGEDGEPQVAIDGIDIGSLDRAGFTLDLQPVRERFLALREESRVESGELARRFRETAYRSSRLNELPAVLGEAFQLIGLDQFLNSRSGALYGKYLDEYRGHAKEISVFMDRERFAVYDYLNDNLIGHATSPDAVAEIIADHLCDWRHKVDFYLALQAHAPDGHPVSTVGPVGAADYVERIRREEAAREDEIRRNREAYLREVGKLGRPEDVAEHARRHHDVHETGTLETKRILGGLGAERFSRIRTLFHSRKQRPPQEPKP
jgi:hypothetical protein